MDGNLLRPGAKVGDVVKVEADIDLEGISVLQVIADKAPRAEPERLELIGSTQPFEPVVTTLATKQRSDRPPRRDRPPRTGDDPDARRARPRRDATNRNDRGPRHDRPAGAPRDGSREGSGQTADAPTASAGETRQSRPPRARTPRPPRAARPAPPPVEAKPKPKRLRPGRTHRKALLANLPPEQLPVAEQLLAGGLPAVRQAIVTQNTALKAEGKPEVPAKSLIALAEQMLPQVRAAEWRDRAEAALADVDEIDLRDLRSVVGADDAARDEESRALAAQLREALTARVEKEHAEWLAEIGTALDESRVVRALRLSTRPPKAGARFPAALATRLAEAAGASLHAQATPDRWIAVLEAIAFSPVRSSVTAASVPSPVPDELTTAITRSAGALPQIAAQFGIEPPAITGPPKPRRPAPPKRPAKKAPPTARPAEASGTVEPATETEAETESAPEPAVSAETVTEPAAAASVTTEPEAAPSVATEPTRAPDVVVEPRAEPAPALIPDAEQAATDVEPDHVAAPETAAEPEPVAVGTDLDTDAVPDVDAAVGVVVDEPPSEAAATPEQPE